MDGRSRRVPTNSQQSILKIVDWGPTNADECTDGECRVPFYAQGRVVIHKLDVERGGPVEVSLESVVFTEVTITEDRPRPWSLGLARGVWMGITRGL